MAYATVPDIEERYGEMTVEQESQAAVLLEDAAAMIDAFVDVDPSDERQAAILMQVSCAMVNRAIAAGGADAFGVSNASYTMGPFTQSATFSNPSGDMYFTAMEKRLLGIGTATIGAVRPVIGWTGD